MKKKLKLFLFYIPILISFPLLSQQVKIDSLILVLKTAKEDSTKVNTLITLGRQYSNIGGYEHALKYAQQAFQLSEKLLYENGIGNAYNNIGEVYWNVGNFDKSLNHFNEALIIWKKIGNKKGMANSYNNLGLVYWNLGNYELAVYNLLKSLKIWEEIGNKNGIGMAYLNIGNIYLNQGMNEKALNFYSKSLKINSEIGNKNVIAINLNNIGIIYENQGNLEKALENQLKALKIREEIKDKKGVAMSYNNIGLIYYEQRHYSKALEYQHRSEIINKEIGNTLGLAVSYTNMGNIYMRLKKFEEALIYDNLALSLSESIGYKLGMKETYFSLAQLNEERGNYIQALKYHKLFSEIKDTLLNEKSSEQITEMNTKYDTEKKDKEIIKKDLEISKHQAETERQTLQRNAFIIGFALVMVLAFFIFKGYRQKQNANRLLEEKNILIEKQKQLVEEKNGKITDSINYAKRIQQAILPSEEMIKSALPDSFVFFKPKDIVSGDFYWLHTINKNEVLFAVADCTGHGVPGALMSMMGFNLLEQVVKEHHVYEPALILNELNKLMMESLRQTDEFGSKKNGTDIALCKINFQNLELEYAGAHNSLYLIRYGILTEIKADRRSVGISFPKSGPFLNHKIKLEKDDCLYVFSDGYADQKGGLENKKFFYQPFKDMLIDNHQLSMQEQLVKFELVISEWQGNNEQIDDMLLIGVRI
ncbi:MAG: tetratricopeptide repeat protein [Bacteroidia bacterium]|nr:tetratricopeptide repeat protein [Bacteroidia bacterium]